MFLLLAYTDVKPVKWRQDEDVLSEGDGIASRGSEQYKGQAKYTSCKESRALDKVIELLTFSKASLGELTVGSYIIQFSSIPRYGYFAAAVNRTIVGNIVILIPPGGIM